MISNYKDLIVWQKSMDLAVVVYNLVKYLPREELFGLSDQMRRAVVSIPSNIAEGQQRSSVNDYKRFLYIARGSLAELETQFLLCEKMCYLNKDQTNSALSLCSEIGKMLYVLIKNLGTEER